MMRYGGWGYSGMNWFGYGVSWFFQLAFWGIIIWFIFTLFRHARGRYPEEDHDSAMKILRERYAKGEITKKEFEEMKKDIS
jgi:putative membrane protein